MRQHLITALIILLHTIAVKAQSPFSTFGGNARIQALANTPFVTDISDIVLNPAYISDYRNTVFADIGYGSNDNFFAANIGISKRITIALLNTNKNYQNNRYYYFPLNDNGLIGNYFTSGIPFGESLPPEKNYGLLTSVDFSGIKVGAGFNYSAGLLEEGYSSPKLRLRKNTLDIYGLNIGILYPVSGTFLLDATFSYQKYSKKIFDTDKPTQSLDYNSYVVRAKIEARSSANLTYYGLFNLYTLSGKQKRLEQSLFANELFELDSPSRFAYNFGAGVNYSIDNIAVSGGLLFQSYEQKQDSAPLFGLNYYKYKTLTAPALFAGIEYKPIYWLTVRGGYSTQSMEIENIQALSNTYYFKQNFSTDVTSGLSLGAGLTFGSFNLNLYMSPNVIRYGLGNLSGNKDTFSYMSASYSF